jgi:hypothetical protein
LIRQSWQIRVVCLKASDLILSSRLQHFDISPAGFSIPRVAREQLLYFGNITFFELDETNPTA